MVNYPRLNDQTLNDASNLLDSIQSTPRENPLNNLPKIDLTLSAQIHHEYIKESLIQLLTDMQTQNSIHQDHEFPKNFKFFPKFGNSPSHTPNNITPPILSPHQIVEPQIEPPKKVNKKFAIELD